MTRLTSWVLDHKLIVVVSWLVLTFAGAATVQLTADRLTVQFKLPGSEG